jgi:membrane protease YdiL (CAAX protease family)
MARLHNILLCLTGLIIFTFFGVYGPLLVYQSTDTLLPSWLWTLILQIPGVTVLLLFTRSIPPIPRITKSMFFSCFLTLLLMGLVYLCLYYLPQIRLKFLDSLVLRPLFVQTQLGFFIGALVLAPFIEEFVYRGVLVDFLTKYQVPASLQAVLTASLFSFFHFNSLGVVPLFLFGLCLFALRHKYQSLTPCILTHFIYNATILGLIVVSSR